MKITVGGENALILSANAEGTDLTIEVPDVPSTDLGPAGVDIVVQTSAGTVTAAKGFLHLGVGHPRTLAVSTILSVALDVSRAVPLADAFALLDAGHRSITLLAQGTGVQGLTLPLAGAPFLAFGSSTSTRGPCPGSAQRSTGSTAGSPTCAPTASPSDSSPSPWVLRRQ